MCDPTEDYVSLIAARADQDFRAKQTLDHIGHIGFSHWIIP